MPRYTTVTPGKVFDFIIKAKEVIFAISAIGLAILNIWFASKSAPVIRSIDLLDSRVSAQESTTKILSDDLQEHKDDSQAVLERLDERTLKTQQDVAFIKGQLSK